MGPSLDTDRDTDRNGFERPGDRVTGQWTAGQPDILEFERSVVPMHPSLRDRTDNEGGPIRRDARGDARGETYGGTHSGRVVGIYDAAARRDGRRARQGVVSALVSAFVSGLRFR
ncbi:hypothetical protein GCM10017557_64380 [Streptomyces aurantiacus]|uniref:Uncharacterized protein n=1 Tax=Streptomyces aurantiacus TaxID=47760 RepID=A0A7G1P8E0_9ACTN|nr:hypothetical protein GCM10017557_64380 [Streptomyces aurantiacus]